MLIGINPWYYSGGGPAPGYDWQYYLPPRYDYYPRNGRNIQYREYQTTVVSQNPDGFSDIPQAYSSDNSVVEVAAIRPTGNPIAYYIIIYIKGDGNCGITVTADGITKTYYTEVSNSFYAYPFNDPNEQHVISTLQNFSHSTQNINVIWSVDDSRTVHMDTWTYQYVNGDEFPTAHNYAKDISVRIEYIYPSFILPGQKVYQTVSGQKAQVLVSFGRSDGIRCTYNIPYLHNDGLGWQSSTVRSLLNSSFKNALDFNIPIKKVYVPSYSARTGLITEVEDEFFLPAASEYNSTYTASSIHPNKGDGVILDFMNGKARGDWNSNHYMSRTISNQYQYQGVYIMMYYTYWYQYQQRIGQSGMGGWLGSSDPQQNGYFIQPLAVL